MKLQLSSRPVGSVHVQVTSLSPIAKLSPDAEEQYIVTSVPELSVQDAAKVAAISLESDGAVKSISAGHQTIGLVPSVWVRNVRRFKKFVFWATTLGHHMNVCSGCSAKFLTYLDGSTGQWNARNF